MTFEVVDKDSVSGGNAYDSGQDGLFQMERSWTDVWWGLPEFTAQEVKAAREILMRFATEQDYQDFRKELQLNNRSHQKKIWWPPPERAANGEYFWQGEPSDTKYPVYIPSKGRYDCATTPKLLDQAGVHYFLVVEPTETELYKEHLGGSPFATILELPFADLGQGSIPARNWIWDHAIQNDQPWHWIIDDNVHGLGRSHNNKRLMVYKSSAPLRMVEDFADRYDNLAFAGLSERGFMADNMTVPVTFNTRVYSVTLINSALPHRWRGRYNEDTDLCLRALKDGWATVLFRDFLMDKHPTSRGDGSQGMKGGNTDNVYEQDSDHRLKFAESLKEQHPDVVEIIWRWERWHHSVDYSPFKRNELRLKAGVTPTGNHDEYGLQLIRDTSKGNT